MVNQDAINKMQKDIKIVYTPLHGTGNIPVQRILKEIGFENVYVVPEQENSRWRVSNSKLSKSRRSKSIYISFEISK